MGKLQVFDIRFTNPNGVCLAGQALSGQVLIELSEPMKMRNIQLSFLGRGKVHWTRTTHSGKHRHTKHYRAEEIYFNNVMYLFGSASGDAEMHPAGVHPYNFSFNLPQGLPSSFEGEYGYVRYECNAKIDKPWKFDHNAKVAFTVISHLDLNQEQNALMLRRPMQGAETQGVSCCCCVSGEVTGTFRIDRMAYVPGENIIINAEIQNKSNTDVSGSRVAIKQYIEFYARHEGLFGSGNLQSRSVSRIVAEASRDQVQAGQNDKWENVALRIPPIPPSRLVGCNIINIAYVIKFYVSVNYGSDIKLACDLIIGTIPFRDLYAAPPYSGAITTQPQPSAPPPVAQDGAQPTAPSDITLELPPPAYSECVYGRVNISEDNDNEYTRGQLNWAPQYPVYNLPPPQIDQSMAPGDLYRTPYNPS